MLLFALVACVDRNATREPGSPDTSGAEDIITSYSESIDDSIFRGGWGEEFDPESISVGDTVGNLVVAKREIAFGDDLMAVRRVRFRGTIELTGRIESDGSISGKQCFEATAVTARSLPRWQADDGRPEFCFSNQRTALRALPYRSDGVYTVVISAYSSHSGKRHLNSARLDTVLSHFVGRRPPGHESVDTVRAIADASTAPVSPHEFWKNVGLRFHPDTIAVGQRFGDLTVSRLSIRSAYDSARVGSAWFAGQIELSGRMMRHPDGEISDVCFEADSMSAARMPRWMGDSRRPWFCFRDSESARKKVMTLGSDSLTTIVVDSFTIHRGMSDEVNSARLLRQIRPSSR